jgi:hypothetical protein
MTDKKETLGAAPISAKELRARMAEKELEQANKSMAKREQLDKEQEEVKDYFMNSEVSDDDRRRLRERVARLADQGQTEMCVLTFSSDFCGDGGRAINNFQPDWPATLTGRAAKLFALWEQNAKPLGYKLEARVLNYPKGIIGDIGLFVSW